MRSRIISTKHCFRYCGDDRCNCKANPRNRGRAILDKMRRENAKKTKAEIIEKEHLDGN